MPGLEQGRTFAYGAAIPKFVVPVLPLEETLPIIPKQQAWQDRETPDARIQRGTKPLYASGNLGKAYPLLAAPHWEQQ